jgi:hypothetical protein
MRDAASSAKGAAKLIQSFVHASLTLYQVGLIEAGLLIPQGETNLHDLVVARTSERSVMCYVMTVGQVTSSKSGSSGV